MSHPPVLTNAHYQVFGIIVSLYAKAEDGFRTALALLLGTSVEAVTLLCAPYSASSLRDVLKSTAKLTLVEGPALNKLLTLIGDPQTIAKLRNHIAHSQWQAGSTQSSIQPVYGDVRQGKFRMFGWGGNTIEYSTADLTRLHDLAINLNAALFDFLISEEFEQALVGRRSLHNLQFWMDELGESEVRQVSHDSLCKMYWRWGRVYWLQRTCCGT